MVRNTHAVLLGIARLRLESADALGPASCRPIAAQLAAPAMLAGIKTAAVINAAATPAALISPGGYVQPILTGIRLDDVGFIGRCDSSGGSRSWGAVAVQMGRASWRATQTATEQGRVSFCVSPLGH